MAKDYAKYFSNKKPGRRGLVDVLLVFLLVLLVSGLIYAAYAHQHNAAATQQVGEWMTRVKVLFSHKKVNPENKTPIIAKQQVAEQHAAESAVRFDFYTALPAMQVTPSAAPASTATLPPPLPLSQNKESVQPAGHYFLQLGVFKSQAAASQVRLSLLLAGIDAVIEKTTAGSKTVYRIQQGPFIKKKQAQTSQLELQKKGVLAVIRKG